jgi:hypothetical protein
MIEVEVSRSGLELLALAGQFSGPLRQKLVEKLADIAWASTFWGAPRKTGYLASTIAKDVGDGEASVKVLASYASFVVQGTKPHVIRPVNASVLAFMGSGGKMVFTKLVNHPGTKPNSWLQKAVEDVRGKVEETFVGLVEELKS